MIELAKMIEARGWTQAEAAKRLEVTQPRISDLMRGKLDRFSIDTLIAMLSLAGANVTNQGAPGKQRCLTPRCSSQASY
jgi:predicted XRE-type DNA-binding protein